MARPASGKEMLSRAKEHLAKARTIGELRQVQAVILPLEFGFTMDQVASIIGVSKGWVRCLITDGVVIVTLKRRMPFCNYALSQLQKWILNRTEGCDGYGCRKYH